MAIRGSLETFSLPELFQIIESGKKSGKLKFNPSWRNSNSELKSVFELWFDKGNFVTIVDSSKYEFLINKIIENDWMESKSLVKAKYSCPRKVALGDYFQKENFLSSSQIRSLFKSQVKELNKLFKVDSAWFKFEEMNSITQVTSDGDSFPLLEMTGRYKKATALSLKAMRDLSDWSRFAEEMPADNCGLQKVVDECDLKLTALEKHLWNCADSSISLKKIAQKREVSIEKVQQTALSIIFAGLVEEVPVVSGNSKAKSNPRNSQKSAMKEQNNIVVKARNKSKVSSSLVNNLVSFLKSNF